MFRLTNLKSKTELYTCALRLRRQVGRYRRVSLCKIDGCHDLLCSIREQLAITEELAVWHQLFPRCQKHKCLMFHSANWERLRKEGWSRDPLRFSLLPTRHHSVPNCRSKSVLWVKLFFSNFANKREMFDACGCTYWILWPDSKKKNQIERTRNACVDFEGVQVSKKVRNNQSLASGPAWLLVPVWYCKRYIIPMRFLTLISLSNCLPSPVPLWNLISGQLTQFQATFCVCKKIFFIKKMLWSTWSSHSSAFLDVSCFSEQFSEVGQTLSLFPTRSDFCTGCFQGFYLGWVTLRLWWV